MNNILLFGAGKSATVLIDYLKDLSQSHGYGITVADGDLELVKHKVGDLQLVHAVQVNVLNEFERRQLIKQTDIVISLLPPSLHYLVALDCLEFEKHLLTASYIDEKIKPLANEVAEKKLLFLCEMGLDPGIDHMSAMQIIHRIKAIGGNIISFKSHCGGLVSPEDDDNPWHYKISWNPKNVVNAGKAGAIYRQHGKTLETAYEELFASDNLVFVGDQLLLANYPNRDSLSYIGLYKLEEAETFIRTTLRHPDFIFGWRNIIELRLTDDEYKYNTNGMTYAEFFKKHFELYGFSAWLNEMLETRLTYAKDIMENLISLIESEEILKQKGTSTDETIMLVNEKGELDTLEVDDVKDKAAASMAVKMHEANLTLKQLFFLGLDSEEEINHGNCTAAEILQTILEKKWVLQPNDKDMVVMMHEFDYILDGLSKKLKSYLIVKGENNLRTAMATTVGLPLGIAAKLILEGKLEERGLHIPINAAIYLPVLKELEAFGIKFTEYED